MTAKELRRQHQVDKQRKRGQFARVRASHARMPQAISEEQQEEESVNPGIFLSNLGSAIATLPSV